MATTSETRIAATSVPKAGEASVDIPKPSSAIDAEIIPPIMKTSPCAKLISSRMPYTSV